jgi:hypothetical protein
MCSVCSIPLCKRCMIDDDGRVFCDGCYADNGDNDDDDHESLVAAEREIESEDYVDMELMDMLDTDDDAGLF